MAADLSADIILPSAALSSNHAGMGRQLTNDEREYLYRLGQKIAELRRDLGYSQQSFADFYGVNRTVIGNIECGKRDLSTSSLRRLALSLGVTVSELFEGMDRPKSKRRTR